MREPRASTPLTFDSPQVLFFIGWDGTGDDAEAAYITFYSGYDVPHRDVWCEWLRRHSIDPNDVAVPGYIRRNRVARRVEYKAYVRAASGNIVVWPPTGDAETEERYVQLEASPMPFPDCVLPQTATASPTPRYAQVKPIDY